MKRGAKRQRTFDVSVLDDIDELIRRPAPSAIIGSSEMDSVDDEDAHSSDAISREASSFARTSLSPLNSGVTPAQQRGGARTATSRQGKGKGSQSPIVPPSPSGSFPSASDDAASESSAPCFLSELALRQRGMERDVDSALFHADTLGAARGSAGQTLLDLAQHFNACGPSALLSSIRKMGKLQKFIAALVRADLSSPAKFDATLRLCYVMFLGFVTANAPLEVLSQQRLYQQLVGLASPSALAEDEGSATTSKKAAPTTAASAKPHWSARLRQSNNAKSKAGSAACSSQNGAAPPPGELLEEVRRVTGDDDSASSQQEKGDRIAPLSSAADADVRVRTRCLETLTQLILAHNRASEAASPLGAAAGGGGMMERQGSSSSTTFSGLKVNVPGPELFLRAGGFSACAALVDNSGKRGAADDGGRAAVELQHAALRLLEVATCSTCLQEADAEDVFRSLLGAIIAHAVTKKGVDAETFELGVRVCINVTSLFPATIPQDVATCESLAAALAREIAAGLVGSSRVSGNDRALQARQKEADDDKSDVALSCIALVVNLMRCNHGSNDGNGGASSAGNDNLRWALLETDGFVAAVAAAMRVLYDSNDAELNVKAGYCAMLLALLSLGDHDARVQVITAVTQNSVDDARRAQVISKPMKLVAAILVEFVMFQSAAGILVQSTLVSMNRVIDRVVAENGIQLEASQVVEEAEGDDGN